MEKVKHKLLVLSGKGGVGKSSVTAELALSLVRKGYRVGILDIDLTGPSMPEVLNLSGQKIHQSSNGWIPVYTDSTKKLGLVSLGFLLGKKDDPVIWRGPKKNAMIKQFVNDINWGELDYLIIDTPPGTSDEHISIAGYLKEYNPDGAVIVTTPQGVSLIDVRREINFCRKVGIRVLGLIENMSGFICPHCQDCTEIFASGGGEALSNELGIDFYGRIPIDPTLTSLIESGDFTVGFYNSKLYSNFQNVITKLEASVA